jgi:hypothetical protein
MWLRAFLVKLSTYQSVSRLELGGFLTCFNGRADDYNAVSVLIEVDLDIEYTEVLPCCLQPFSCLIALDNGSSNAHRRVFWKTIEQRLKLFARHCLSHAPRVAQLSYRYESSRPARAYRG